MRVVINGEWREAADGINIAQLLESLSLPPRRVAVERNKQLVPRAQHGDVRVCEGDNLEIVTLVGGG